jgi:diguanylate cyclase (GGDEF)-like protein
MDDQHGRQPALWVALRRLATVGVVPDCEPADRLKVVLVNVSAMLALVSSLLFNVLFFITGNWGLVKSGLVQWPFALLTCATFWLHANGHYWTARAYAFWVIFVELCTVIVSGQGLLLSSHYYMLLLTVLCLPLFRLSEWRWAVFFMLVSTGGFLFFELRGWPADPLVAQMHPAWLHGLRMLVVGICVGTAMVIVLMTEGASEDYVRRLEALAMSDALTGLPNRRAGVEKLAREIALCQRTGQALSVAMLDIDFFKKVNDEEGHDVGDLALRHVADVTQKNLRSMDFVARMGGEEFIVILPSTSLAQAYSALEAVRAAIANTPFQWAMSADKNRGNRELTVSMGVAEVAQSLSSDELLHLVDMALYQAKSQGRNQVVVYDLNTTTMPADLV